LAWLETAAFGLKAADLTYKLAGSSSTIKLHLSRFVNLVKKGSATVPIFGCGGAGKTTLGRLIGGADPLNLAAPYRESFEIDTVKLRGEYPGTVSVGPGQKDRISRYWPELFRLAISSGNLGIINVVAYGLHSIELQRFEEHDLFAKGMDLSEFSQVFSESRRALEIEFLRKMIHGLSAVDGRLWMITPCKQAGSLVAPTQVRSSTL
jgi:hypothetical protein